MFNRKKKHLPIENPSTIEQMVEASFPVLPFPYNGVTVYCKVRCLNGIQLRAIGEFNLIDINDYDNPNSNKKPTLSQTIKLLNWQEALLQETLISPTLDEIQEKIYGQDCRISELKNKLKIIRQKIKEVEPEQRKELSKEADTIELYVGSLLPTDFMNAVTSWATGVDRSDIKKINRDILLEAAILAFNGKDNPADHIEGNFLDFHKDEINKCSWIIYNEYQERKEIEKKLCKGSKNTVTVRGGAINK